MIGFINDPRGALDILNGDDAIDLLADLCAHWKRNRERNITPKSVRAAIVLQCREISAKDLGVRSFETRLDHLESGRTTTEMRLATLEEALDLPRAKPCPPKKSRIEYHFRGMYEHGNGKRKRMVSGYSTADGVKPWMTKRECIKDATARGMKPVFIRDGKEETSA